MSPQISLIAAFAAGLLSITSPCVFPLIPVYLAHLADGVPWADTVTTIQTRTRQFAKRQLTWFRALPAGVWRRAVRSV